MHGHRKALRRFAAGVLACAGGVAFVVLVAFVVRAHVPTIMQIYREPPKLKSHKWQYEKSDLPSAKIAHPVYGPEAWWVRPKAEWQKIHDGWSEEKRAKIPGGVAGMEKELARMVREAHASVEHIMKMPEEELLRYVPPQTPIGRRRNYCPRCMKSSSKLVWVGPAGWDKVKCTSCSMVFPNEKYPADRKHAIGGPLGKPVTFRYHRDRRGFNHFFEALTYAPRRDRAVDYGLALARAYHVTRRAEYARRAALLLDRLTSVYQRWCMMSGADPHVYLPGDGFHSAYKKVTRWSGRWMFGVPYEACSSYEPIYDMIYESEELDRLSEEQGYDVRRHIERNFFYENIAVFFSAKPPLGPHGSLEYISVVGTIRRARILNDARLIHRCYGWAKEHVARFHCDGAFGPRIGYHKAAAAGLDRVMAELEGWTDPPGFVPKDKEHRFESFDAAKDFPILARIGRAAGKIAYPDGRACPVHDTEVKWIGGTRKAECSILPGFGHAVLGAGPAQVGASPELPAPGQLTARAARGPGSVGRANAPGPAGTDGASGMRAVQSHLHFSGDHGHGHRDNLNLTLFAFGREMLADIGYCGSGAPARWAQSTLAHNTVVIDGRSQMSALSETKWRLTGCDLLLYVPTMPGLSVVEARGDRAYPGARYNAPRAETYRRMQMLVTIDPNRPYVVDIFRVKGGRAHDYVLHGACDHPMLCRGGGAASFRPRPEALSLPESGGEGGAPRGAGRRLFSKNTWKKSYGLFRDVRRAATSEGWNATFVYKDRPDTGTRVHMLGGAETEVFLARTPSCRHAPRGPAHEADHARPSLIARRRLPAGGQGAGGLESLYVAVIEPFGLGPGITSVESVETSLPGDRVIGLRVRMPGRTDTLLVASEGAGRVRTVDGVDGGGMEMDGRIGLVSEGSGGHAGGWLIGGTRLRAAPGSLKRATPRGGKGEMLLAIERGVYSGEIDLAPRMADGADTDAFVVAEDIPGGRGWSGAFVVVTMPRVTLADWNTSRNPYTRGYEIARIEKRQGKTWIHTNGDHGLRMGTDMMIHEACAPGLAYQGKLRYTIHDRTCRFVPPPAISPEGGPLTGPVEVALEARASGSATDATASRAAIRYTTDGTEPSRDSALYGGPFTVTSPTTVKARAYAGDMASVLSTATFVGPREPEDVQADDLVKGLEYRYWEGAGGLLFEYGARAPLASGTAEGPTLGPVRRAPKEGATHEGQAPSEGPYRTWDFAIEYTGYVSVPRAGVYEFSLRSEGTGRLEIGPTVVARRDLSAPRPVTASGSVGLKAGFHPVRVTYASGVESGPGPAERGFRVDWKTPEGAGRDKVGFFRRANRVSISPGGGAFEGRVVVALSADRDAGLVRFTLDGTDPTPESRRYRRPFRLRRPGTVKARVFDGGDGGDGGKGGPVARASWTVPLEPVFLDEGGTTPGLVWRYREGDWSERSDPGRLEYEQTGATEDVALVRSRPAPFALRLDGYLRVPRDGVYTFYLTSRDLADVYIAGKSIVSSTRRNTLAGAIALRKGWHPLRIDYVRLTTLPQRAQRTQGAKGEARNARPPVRSSTSVARRETGLRLSFEGPGMVRRAVGPGDLRRARELVSFTLPGALAPDQGPAVAAAGPDGFSFYQKRTVKLVSEKKGASVRYTLDGSRPAERSPVYTGPITLTDSATVKATVFPAPVASAGIVSSVTLVRLAPRKPDDPEDLTRGLHYRHYKGRGWRRLPDFGTFGVVGRGTVDELRVPPRRQGTDFALEFEGYISVPADGLYRFFLKSEDGSMLFVGEELVVDNDGEHGMDRERGGSVALGSGAHAISVFYFAGAHRGRKKGLVLSYEGPGMTKRPVPPEVLHRRAR